LLVLLDADWALFLFFNLLRFLTPYKLPEENMNTFIMETLNHVLTEDKQHMLAQTFNYFITSVYVSSF
jgi:hypothetical protein